MGLALMIIWMALGAAHACEVPALNLKFEGTAFARENFQVAGSKIYFFRNTPRAISLAYIPNKKQWCYQKVRASLSLPVRGCLSREVGRGKSVLRVNGKVMPHFVLRDSGGAALATLNVTKNQLTAYFLSPNGKATGKRIEFKSLADQGRGSLQVIAWNCPNSRFLTCAGSDLQTVAEESSENPLLNLKSLELSKNLAHYSVSCQGLHEGKHHHEAGVESAFAPGLK